MNFKNKLLLISLVSAIALWHCGNKKEPGGDGDSATEPTPGPVTKPDDPGPVTKPNPNPNPNPNPTSTAPDLTVEADLSSTQGASSEEIMLQATVRNTGTGSSDATTLRWYLSADDSLDTDTDTPLETETIISLAAGFSTVIFSTIMASSTPGTYFYGACVNSVMDEANTANNCSSVVMVVVFEPELTVSISPASSKVAPGGTLTLTATVNNMGMGSSPATTLRWYSSTDMTIDTDDDPIGSAVNVSGLMADSASDTISNTITVSDTTGTYYYGVCVNSVTGEADTMNNCSSAAMVVVKDPSLSISIAAGSTKVAPDGMLTLMATVMNAGGSWSSSNESVFFWYRSRDDSLDRRTDNQQGDQDIPSNFPGGVDVTISNVVTAPSDLGTYYYFVCMENDIFMGDCLSTVVVVAAPPDLAVSISSVSNANVASSAMVTLTAVVSNIGEASSSSGQTGLRWYSSADRTITTTDTRLEANNEDTVNDLMGGNSEVITYTVTVSSTAGTYYYGACVRSVPGESDITNNCSPGAAVVVSESSAGNHLEAIDLTGLSAADNEKPTGIWSDEETMWVADSEDDKLYAYNLATGARDSAKEFDLQYAASIEALSDETPRGIWSDGTTMWVSDEGSLYAYTMTDKMRDSAQDFTLVEENGSPGNIWSNGTTMWVVDVEDAKLYAYKMSEIDKSSTPADDIALASENDSPGGLLSVGDILWVVDTKDNKVYAYNIPDDERDTTREFDLVAGNTAARGIWSNGSTMWVANQESTENDMAEKIYAYDIRLLISRN